MSDPPPDDLAPFVFDTGPLSAFANAGLLGVLKVLADNRSCVVPEGVVNECRQGAYLHPFLSQILEASWLDHVVVDGAALAPYGRAAKRLVVGTRNQGEAEVIGWASAHGGEAVIDDRTARNVAEELGVPVRGSLRFVIDAINERHLSRDLAADLCNELQAACRLPFGPGGFLKWADENSLLV